MLFGDAKANVSAILAEMQKADAKVPAMAGR